jgi:predicted nucleic acid-binding protein
MGQPEYLIDTNAVIDYLSSKLPIDGVRFMRDIINNVPNISVITRIELLGYNTTTEANQLLVDFIDASSISELSEEVILQTIMIRKKNKIKIPDAIIAATAIISNLTLVSNNSKDFKNIENLKTVNPYKLA